MTQEITKYRAYDGSLFDNLEDANRYEMEAFNEWLCSLGYGFFINDADDTEDKKFCGTERETRKSVLRDLFEFMEANPLAETNETPKPCEESDYVGERKFGESKWMK